ncbi:MAG: hypothetical protein QF632_01980 [Candidatus Woesearchaeota archaeon]|nr:hypothetical protein [Candidatus Woesearchaeota archaeon]MDP7323509.1 hypothetical protein [Candidatus Woesearchaeota archaeon]
MRELTIGKISIRPTKHYLQNHADVEWDLVILTILSPSKVQKNKRYGKDRFTYIKYMKKQIIKIHAKTDKLENIIWVINAFKLKK